MTQTSPSGTAVPDRIVEIATGYMGAKQLFAASRIGLFCALAGGERSAADLASATGVTEHIARILADSMNALGLLERRDGNYALAPDAAAYLCDDSTAGDGPELGAFLTFLNEISYPHWLEFDATVDTGEPGDLKLDEERGPTFMAGVMRFNALHAKMLGRTFDFRGFRSMLDLGGLSPDFAIEAMRLNPELAVRFVFGPESTQPITDALAAAGLMDRATLDPAPTETADPGGDHDLVMANHVLHRFTPAQNRTILKNARAAAAPQATLLLLDFYSDDDPRQRTLDALHAAEYGVIDGTVVYPIADVDRWLAEAGWQRRGLLTVPGSPRGLVATAV